MEIIILIAWNIWTTRNNLIFKGMLSSVQNTKSGFVNDFAMVIHSEKSKFSPLMKIWLDDVM
jgi:hypothetical protein